MKTQEMILNLGCGIRTSPRCVNIDWSPYLRLKRMPLARYWCPLVLRDERLRAFRGLNGAIVAHDLRKGIPFPDNSAGAAYLSHLLEHVDRDKAPGFLSEIRRVLRPGGIVRIVVPDLERLCRQYLEHLESSRRSSGEAEQHDSRVAALIEQMVRREAYGTSRQRPFRRRLEGLILGDARRRGETHQWMYDEVNLGSLLVLAGFSRVAVVDHLRSGIPDWRAIGLDLDGNGGEYKPGSLYMEARKNGE